MTNVTADIYDIIEKAYRLTGSAEQADVITRHGIDAALVDLRNLRNGHPFKGDDEVAMAIYNELYQEMLKAWIASSTPLFLIVHYVKNMNPLLANKPALVWNLLREMGKAMDETIKLSSWDRIQRLLKKTKTWEDRVYDHTPQIIEDNRKGE